MSRLLSDYNPETDTFGMPNTPEAKYAFLQAAAMRNTNWFNEPFRNSIQQNHAVSISGGTDKANFYGLSLFNDPGWSIADKVRRYTANFNLGYKFTDKLKLTFNTSSLIQRPKGARYQFKVIWLLQWYLHTWLWYQPSLAMPSTPPHWWGCAVLMATYSITVATTHHLTSSTSLWE